MKTTREQLEEEILALEEQFSQGKTIDVGSLLAKTKEYTALRVEEAKAEGLTAGLVIQDLKKERQATRSSSLSRASAPVKEPPTEKAPSGVAIANPQNRRYVRIDDREDLRRIREEQRNSPKTIVEPRPKKSPEAQQDSSPEPHPTPNFNFHEGNLGKYLMGILAALLAIIGVVILGALVWDEMPNAVKALLQGILATLMVFVPFRHILEKRDSESNGFLNALMGTGLAIYYVTAVYMGSSWGLISEFPLLFLLVALILLTVGISYKIQSNTLLVIGYLGNICTIAMLSSVESSATMSQIALSLLLSVSIFLMAFTVKNSWVHSLTKGTCFIWVLLLVNVNRLLMQELHRSLYRQEINYVPEYYSQSSSLFSLYLITVLFALLISVALGYLANRQEEFSFHNNTCSLEFIALLLGYFTLIVNFHQDMPVFLLLFIATIPLAKHKANIAMLSVFFLPIPLAEIFSNLDIIEEVSLSMWYLSMAIFSIFLHFLTKDTCSYRYTFAVQGFAVISTVIFLAGAEQGLFALPLLCLWACFLYHGMKQHESPCTFPYLCSFIPLALLTGKLLHLLAMELDDLFFFFPPTLLLFAGLFTLLERYLPWLAEEKRLSILLLCCKIGSLLLLCLQLAHGRQELALLMLQTVALLYAMGELGYRLWNESYEDNLLKPVYLILLLFSSIAWTHSTPLGDFSFVSSILMLILGCVSIFLGFYQSEKQMRHCGLTLAMVAVLKMVTIDVAATDSIVRVLALIVGAVLCFVISCVYNRLLPGDAITVNFDSLDEIETESLSLDEEIHEDSHSSEEE